MDCWSETSQPLLEGNIKYRDGKQWKSRWAIITKPSPIADCLKVLMFKNFKEKLKKNLAPKTMLQLEHYLGMESGFTFDKESNTMAIICVKQTIVVAFETREILLQWQSRLQEHFCKEAHFLVHVMSVVPKNNLCGPHRLLLQDGHFCLVSGIPPRLSFHWPIKQLRRFGIIEGKFCFEGGSQCGKGAGLHILYTSQPEQLARYFELASNCQLNSLMTNGHPESQDERSARNRLAHQQRQRSINSGSDSGDSSCQLLSSTDDVLESLSNYCLDSIDCHYHSSMNLNQKSLDGSSNKKSSYSFNTISRFSSLAEKSNLVDFCKSGIDQNHWKMVQKGVQLNPQSREGAEMEERVDCKHNCESILWNGGSKVHQDDQGSGVVSKKTVIAQCLNDRLMDYDVPRNVCMGALNGPLGEGRMKNEGPVNDCVLQQVQLCNNVVKSDLGSQVCGCNNILGSSAIETMAGEWSTCEQNYGFNDISQSDESNTATTNRRKQSNFGYENMYFLNTMQLYENMCLFRKNPNDAHTVQREEAIDGTSLSLCKEEGKKEVGETTNDETGIKENGDVKHNETGDNEPRLSQDLFVEDGDGDLQQKTTESFEKLEICNFQTEAEAEASVSELIK